MTYPCSGRCGLSLSMPEAFCISCWPPEQAAPIHSEKVRKLFSVKPPMDRPSLTIDDVNGVRAIRENDLPLDLQILANAYRLNRGNAQEKKDALHSLAHLVHVLQQETNQQGT